MCLHGTFCAVPRIVSWRTFTFLKYVPAERFILKSNDRKSRTFADSTLLVLFGHLQFNSSVLTLKPHPVTLLYDTWRTDRDLGAAGWSGSGGPQPGGLPFDLARTLRCFKARSDSDDARDDWILEALSPFTVTGFSGVCWQTLAYVHPL